ncbi:thioesterase domain-containing protein [Micromonospora sp. CPCC 205546]|uniref:thioesterase domain-containing protein n=1 Tax=Micromonospora sp. CPCC 205546 TaxID=3122397 RepID=UPI002FF0F228
MALEQDRIVQVLQDVWAELLAVEVAEDDDFFELGGYSLLIVNVVAEARRHGVELSSNDVFLHKTPKAIAAALTGGSTPQDAAPAGSAGWDFAEVWATGAAPMAVPPTSNLVLLATGGTETPIFCIHWGTGNVGFMRKYVDRFRGDRPAYGLEMIGLRTRVRPPLSVVEAATRYLAEIRTVQPQGPYLFLGLCTGGRIAYEIARQLEARGEQVALLAVVNTLPPGVRELDPGWGLREVYDFRGAGVREKFGVSNPADDPQRLLDAMRELEWVDEEVVAEELPWRQMMWAAGIFGHENYEAQRYGGDVTVYQSREVADRPDSAWDHLVRDAEAYTFSAPTTLDVVRDPAFAEALAKKLTTL